MSIMHRDIRLHGPRLLTVPLRVSTSLAADWTAPCASLHLLHNPPSSPKRAKAQLNACDA